jgi:IclR family transcriptional regulator, acetate operon repressor
MSGVLQRTLAVLEHLMMHPEGVALGVMAEKLNMPPSAAHRLLTELAQLGYVKQARDQGDYALTTKLVAKVLDYMGAAGIADFAQPVLDRLARDTGEFIRLAVVDGEQLTWVARAQGARHGLRYDPAIDATAQLSCTASGHAWLMTMPEEAALTLVARQGFGKPEHFGPNAPTTPQALLERIAAARQRGYATTADSFDVGLSSMAVPVQRAGESPVGVLSVAGPTVRLTTRRFEELFPVLRQAAGEIATASATSPLFVSRRAASGASERNP